jgi:hypothetical protein
MFKQADINDILKQVAHLDESAQQEVAQKINALVNKQKGKAIPITTLNGLGAKIWKRKNVVAYIEELRNW